GVDDGPDDVAAVDGEERLRGVGLDGSHGSGERRTCLTVERDRPYETCVGRRRALLEQTLQTSDDPRRGLFAGRRRPRTLPFCPQNQSRECEVSLARIEVAHRHPLFLPVLPLPPFLRAPPFPGLQRLCRFED